MHTSHTPLTLNIACPDGTQFPLVVPSDSVIIQQMKSLVVHRLETQNCGAVEYSNPVTKTA